MGYNPITRYLSQGSAPPPGPIPFDALVLTAMEYQPQSEMYPGVDVIRAPMDDARPTVETVRIATHAARQVGRLILARKEVLVTCYMGLNRSGLVSGLTLIELGFNADEAIQAVRAARGNDALSNHWFVQLLRVHSTRLGRAPSSTPKLKIPA